MKPKLLDLFCGAGGAGAGYHRAGFDVTGVDIAPQKRYPFTFIQGDALEYVAEHGHEYDVIHASPPCENADLTQLGHLHKHKIEYLEAHPNLIPQTRALLIASGKPYIIENVEGAAEFLINPLMLCGTMFGLKTKHGSQLKRHRLFETHPAIWFPPAPCMHNKEASVIGVHGGGQHPDRRRVPPTIGVYGNSGGSSSRAKKSFFGIDDRRDAMDIDWMTNAEIVKAIPPAYTEFIGRHIMQYVLERTQ